MAKQILIVGGGAAGLAAAIAAADTDPTARITVLEAFDRVGKKILATGNGHCNLTNEYITPACYHTDEPQRLEKILADIPSSKAVSWFENLGLACMTDEAGRVYPYCRQASMVLDVLLLAIRRRGNIRVECCCKITGMTAPAAKGQRFALTDEQGRTWQGDCVILTTGGKAAPKLGGLGIGYRLAKAAGHSVTPLRPCLTGLSCPSPLLKPLKGIRVRGAVSLTEGGKVRHTEAGELQLNEASVSGIPAMQLSCLVNEKTDGMMLDFFPNTDYNTLRNELQSRLTAHPKEPLEDALLGLLHKRIQFALCKSLKIDVTRPAGQLVRGELDRLVSVCKGWRLPLGNITDWDNAQVTGGGVPLHEILPDFQSKKQRGLYLAGEILDVTGECGGYNLHWAWCSGMAAGTAATK